MPSAPPVARRCGFCGEAAVAPSDATQIVSHGVPLGFEQRWTCASCGQSFATLSPLLYLIFLGGAVLFAGLALFGPISGSEEARIFARLFLLLVAGSLAVLGGTRLRADRRNPRC
jgi:hypothetical protein